MYSKVVVFICFFTEAYVKHDMPNNKQHLFLQNKCEKKYFFLAIRIFVLS